MNTIFIKTFCGKYSITNKQIDGAFDRIVHGFTLNKQDDIHV